MIQAFGEFGALYYSPTGKPDRGALEAHLVAHWDAIQTVGYIGAWYAEGNKELFIDSVYRIPCGCDTLGGESLASAKFAQKLGRKNHQEAISHVCDDLVETETIGLIYEHYEKDMLFTDDIIAGYTDDPIRFKLWMEATGNKPDDLSELQSLADVEQETFLGEYPDPADYARETTENTYPEELENLPDHVQWAIDWDVVWQNLRHEHHYTRNTDYNTLIWAQY
jgi:hypothetical protein